MLNSKKLSAFCNEVRQQIRVHPVQNIETVINALHHTLGLSAIFTGTLDGSKQQLDYRAAFLHGNFVKIEQLHDTSLCLKILKEAKGNLIVKTGAELRKFIANDLLFENKLMRYFAGTKQLIGQNKWLVLCVLDYKNRNDSEELSMIIGEASKLLVREELQLRKEQQMSEELERYKTVFLNANDGIMLLDNSNTIVEVNQKVCELFLCERQEIIGKKPHELSPKTQPDGSLSSEKALDLIQKALAGEPQRFHWQHMRMDNSLFEAEVSLNSSTLQSGRVVQAVVRDVTSAKKAEKALIDARLKAEDADRLKSAFLANMSHEIRTPLNSIIGFSEIMLDEETDPDEKEQYLQLISSAGKTLLQLIDDIIDISKIEAGQIRIALSEFDLHQVLDEILINAFNERKKREKDHIEIRLRKGLTLDNFFIESDPFRFRQIMMNLLVNALKFVDSGFIEFGYTQPKGGLIQFYVKDTGIGIERDKSHLIFQRFGQIDSTYKRNLDGTGLGLAICNSLIELLGGKIWFDSEEGKGTTFYFTLPAPKNLVLNNKDEVVRFGKINRDWSGLKFLIADDVKANYLFLKAVMKETGAQILWAQNGEEAISIAKQHADLSLVLMDIRMPEIDGYKATKKIKALFPRLPIIAQTAFAETENQKAALEAGCDDYITKPISITELLSVINKLL
jgi:PAS domain S-box-containing protein